MKSVTFQIFACLGFPPEVQNWIVGRHLAVDDNILNDLAEIDTGLILYLYLMPARAVGLTRKAYQEKYIPSFAERKFFFLSVPSYLMF